MTLIGYIMINVIQLSNDTLPTNVVEIEKVVVSLASVVSVISLAFL